MRSRPGGAQEGHAPHHADAQSTCTVETSCALPLQAPIAPQCASHQRVITQTPQAQNAGAHAPAVEPVALLPSSRTTVLAVQQAPARASHLAQVAHLLKVNGTVVRAAVRADHGRAALGELVHDVGAHEAVGTKHSGRDAAHLRASTQKSRWVLITAGAMFTHRPVVAAGAAPSLTRDSSESARKPAAQRAAARDLHSPTTCRRGPPSQHSCWPGQRRCSKTRARPGRAAAALRSCNARQHTADPAGRRPSALRGPQSSPATAHHAARAQAKPAGRRLTRSWHAPSRRSPASCRSTGMPVRASCILSVCARPAQDLSRRLSAREAPWHLGGAVCGRCAALALQDVFVRPAALPAVVPPRSAGARVVCEPCVRGLG